MSRIVPNHLLRKKNEITNEIEPEPIPEPKPSKKSRNVSTTVEPEPEIDARYELASGQDY